MRAERGVGVPAVQTHDCDIWGDHTDPCFCSCGACGPGREDVCPLCGRHHFEATCA